MKPYSKFEDVDIIGALRKIMLHNTQNYQSDFEYDIRMLTGAAQSGTANRSFLWMSRDNGTWCFPARDVYIRNTPSNHTWSYYSYLDSVKAFWIELDGIINGVVNGNITEIDYQKHAEDVKHNSHRANSVEIVFSNPNHVRTFDLLDYNEVKQSILARYGAVEKMEYMVDNESALDHMLDTTRDSLFRNAKPDNIDSYVIEMEREHFHHYGYTKGDMAFTAPVDADHALRQGLPVFALYNDGSAAQVTRQEEIASHVYAGGIFGMSREMKDFLGYLTNSRPDKAPFTRDELDLLYRSVVFAGEGNEALTAGELRHMESLMFKLDTILRPGEPDAQTVREREHENDNGMEV